MFYIGCPAWGYKEWVGHDNFFPPKTPASEFLRLYSQKLWYPPMSRHKMPVLKKELNNS